MQSVSGTHRHARLCCRAAARARCCCCSCALKAPFFASRSFCRMLHDDISSRQSMGRVTGCMHAPHLQLLAKVAVGQGLHCCKGQRRKDEHAHYITHSCPRRQRSAPVPPTGLSAPVLLQQTPWRLWTCSMQLSIDGHGLKPVEQRQITSCDLTGTRNATHCLGSKRSTCCSVLYSKEVRQAAAGSLVAGQPGSHNHFRSGTCCSGATIVQIYVKPLLYVRCHQRRSIDVHALQKHSGHDKACGHVPHLSSREEGLTCRACRLSCVLHPDLRPF